jgi:C-terminal processing protease CtpA/Prc
MMLLKTSRETTGFPAVTIFIGTTYVLRYDGVPIEWNGVLPDIRVPQSKEDIDQGRDKQLEYAIELLR